HRSAILLHPSCAHRAERSPEFCERLHHWGRFPRLLARASTRLRDRVSVFLPKKSSHVTVKAQDCCALRNNWDQAQQHVPNQRVPLYWQIWTHHTCPETSHKDHRLRDLMAWNGERY